ncbi:MAG TPA: proline--tRNA ligase [Chloroflexota bacterium]|nr:proline--tRNA ligase [Chloroflexota bacterium]
MRLSRHFGRTLRDAPAEAETASHRLLVRGGYVDQLAAGLFSLLPLGLRVQRRLEAIVRRELEAAAAQEVLLPVLQPIELWQATGRDAAYGPELYRLQDRRERGFVLAPTHEEAVTRLAATYVRSHRDLPVTLFQIQTKMRDEPRPRAGLLRVREFVMMDAYSFDAGAEGLDASFEAMRGAFGRIFAAAGLPVVPVLADSGAIGGKESVEFVLPAAAGEDTIVTCAGCDYAANLEKAESAPDAAAPPVDTPGAAAMASVDTPGAAAMAPVDTPGVKTIEALASFLGIEPAQTLKAVFYWAGPPGGGPDAGEGLIFAALRGDLEVNETKLRRVLGQDDLRLATDAEVAAAGLVAGSASPVGVRGPRTVVDRSVPAAGPLVAGGNRRDVHLRDVRYGRDFAADLVADIATVRDGDPCPRCGRPLTLKRGIELGHIFKLGVRYSEALGARYLDPAGRQQPLWMGCYGIGIGRTLAAAVEMEAPRPGHDERGIIWPAALAPFDVHLVALNYDHPDVTPAADALYQALQDAGVAALLDDRAESAGVKLNDADLLGLPLRVTLGPRGLRRGGEQPPYVEVRPRTAGDTRTVPLDGAAGQIIALLRSEGTP